MSYPWVITPEEFPNLLKHDWSVSLPLATEPISSGPPDSGVKIMQMRIERVNALPATLSGSTMYVVKSSEAGLADVYFTNNDGTEARHVIKKSEITDMINTSIGNFTNIQLAADITARDALSLTRNALVLVLDATDDATVSNGAALYLYDVVTTAWHKVSEFESMDVTLTWDAIQGRPTSTVAEIDDAVAKAHVHANKAQLDKIGEDADGVLQYNGAYIEAQIAVNEW